MAKMGLLPFPRMAPAFLDQLRIACTQFCHSRDGWPGVICRQAATVETGEDTP